MSSPPVGAKCVDIITVSGLPSPSIRHGARRQRDHGLSFQYPCKFCDYELCILTQPEQQHRARYLTEGSRGAVKDRSQQGYPVIKVSVCFLFLFSVDTGCCRTPQPSPTVLPHRCTPQPSPTVLPHRCTQQPRPTVAPHIRIPPQYPSIVSYCCTDQLTDWPIDWPTG